MRYMVPARSPAVGDVLAARLTALGARIRAQREREKVSAAVAAEAAGMSRVTFHRIERGEPSVTMGAYMSAADAVGLELGLLAPPASLERAPDTRTPDRVRLAGYPQLRRLSWHLTGVEEISAAEAFGLYERNWRHLDLAGMEPAERALVKSLADRLGGGRLLV